MEPGDCPLESGTPGHLYVMDDGPMDTRLQL